MIHADRRGEHVAVVTIDRPERRNAVDHDHVEALQREVEQALADGCRVLVLTGAGGQFCAGADLTSLEDEGFASVLRRLLDGLGDPGIVTMAACDGAALGAGTQLATACDLRVATPAARFGIPAGKLGLMVDETTVRRLVATAGEGTARAMLLAAEVLDGERAHHVGLVHRLGGLDDALDWADAIAALAPLSRAGHKLGLQQPDAREAYRAAFTTAWASADLREGQTAFREKRPPRFEGR